MASAVAPGAWRCNFCQRTLPEADFATDGWRARKNKGPGRCRACDTELARARSALSLTSKLSDCSDNALAYHLAEEVCRSHEWGKVAYV